MNDSPARIDPEEAAIGQPTQTARRLVEASVSPNTRRAYAGALRRLDGRELDDVALAAYLAELHDEGRASPRPRLGTGPPQRLDRRHPGRRRRAQRRDGLRYASAVDVEDSAVARHLG